MFPIQSTTEDSSKLYVDDVFSTYLYTGNGSTQTINNGIDLAGKGGMVWGKRRDASGHHWLFDTARGVNKLLQPHLTDAHFPTASLSAFNPDGFTAGDYINNSGENIATWTFRKAPKFFDVVTYTGNGATTRTLTHSLVMAPGCIIVKRTSEASNWEVGHRSISAGWSMILNSTAAQDGHNSTFNYTATTFSVIAYGASYDTNANGVQYVAYLFAHDTGADGLIQCGSFTTDASGNGNFNHGWSKGVQFCKVKAASGSGDWEMFDTSRTPAWSGYDARLRANLISAEDSVTRLSASGTSLNFTGLSANTTYIGVFIVAP